jgi:hypothetical protein
MKPPARTPVFLERANYRQRRLGDAALFLPVLGLVLWLIPLLWQQDGPDAPSNSGAVIYIFAVWVVLIVLSAVLSRVLRDTPPADTDPPR